MRRIFAPVFASLALFFLPTLAHAHALNAHIYDENGTVFVAAYFARSAPCKLCKLTIADSETNKTIAVLTTDESGKASFKATTNRMRIAIDGGVGHFKEVEHELDTPIDTGDSPLALIAKNAIGLAIIFALFGAIWAMGKLRKRKAK